MTNYTGHRQPASIVCTRTKEEHDAIVAMRGRPYTDDGMRCKNVDAPDTSPVSLIDTYIHDNARSVT